MDATELGGRLRSVPPARWVVGALALGGLGLATNSIGSPTWRLVISDPGRGEVISAQSSWSWGQLSVRSGQSFERIFPNGPGLVLFVAALVVGLLAVGWWLWRPGRQGVLLGVLGLTVATTRLVTAVVERLGNSQIEAYGDTGLDVRTSPQSAAVTETISAGLLLAALGAMAALAVLAGVTELPDAADVAVPPPDETPPLPSTARGPSGIRVTREATTAGRGGAHLAGDDIGFTDGNEPPAAGEARSDSWPDSRFEPPR